VASLISVELVLTDRLARRHRRRPRASGRRRWPLPISVEPALRDRLARRRAWCSRSTALALLISVELALRDRLARRRR
jgi:hypothetical protein